MNELTKENYQVMEIQAKNFVASKFLPEHIKTPEQAIAIMTMGRELNIPPWQAINGINVIKGKPTVAPQLMLAMIERSGQLEDIKINGDVECCLVTMKRNGRSSHKEVFSIQDAEKLGLSSKHNWKAQPATMLKWRAVAACARVVFPDVIGGMYIPDEMENSSVAPNLEAHVVPPEPKQIPENMPGNYDRVSPDDPGSITDKQRKALWGFSSEVFSFVDEVKDPTKYAEIWVREESQNLDCKSPKDLSINKASQIINKLAPDSDKFLGKDYFKTYVDTFSLEEEDLTQDEKKQLETAIAKD